MVNWNYLVGVIWSVLLNQSLIVSLFQVQNTIIMVTFTWQKMNKNSKTTSYLVPLNISWRHHFLPDDVTIFISKSLLLLK